MLSDGALLGSDLDAGHTAAENVGSLLDTHVGNRGVCELHDVDGAGEVLGPGGTVTDDDDVVKEFLGNFKGNGDVRAVANRDLHFFVAYARDDEDCIRSTVDEEFTVGVGCDAIGSSFNYHRGTDDPLAGFIEDCAANAACLGGKIP